MAIEQVLGLDVGMVKTGIARASLTAKLPEPLRTVPTKELETVLSKLLKQYDIDAVVVGLPRSLQGDETAQTSWVREWVQNTKQYLKVPVYWQDEALTSHLAEQELRKGKLAGADEDSLAAAIFLQDFVDSDKQQWVEA